MIDMIIEKFVTEEGKELKILKAKIGERTHAINLSHDSTKVIGELFIELGKQIKKL